MQTVFRTWLFSLLAFAALGATAARAAETTATIVGYVRSVGGLAVAGATVSAASLSGRYRTMSDASGRFLFVAVAADTYTIAANAPGFQSQQLTGVNAFPDHRVNVEFTLEPALREIGHVGASAARPFAVGQPQDTFTVNGDQARGPTVAAGSGLASYLRGTVQGAVASVPGVQQDQYANAIVRAGKVEDVVFSYDAVPLPQALIAEPGGNVIGAQLATTGLGFTNVTTGGFASGSDDALGGLIDQVPSTGVYPAQTTLLAGLGLVPGARDVELEERWATPSLRQRYALDATLGSQSIGYGDGHTFYPAEAATFGLSLATRASWSIASNAHLSLGRRDDLEFLVLAGEATYDQYGTPFARETYASSPGSYGFDGATTPYPNEPSPNAAVQTPSRIRGTYAIEKLQLLRSYDRAYARLRLYRSQYGAATDAPFFDDLSFPNGVVSYFGRQSGDLYGLGFDVRTFASENHQFAYGVELRRQVSALAEVVPTLDETVTSNPVLSSWLAYLVDRWSPKPGLTLQGALRATDTHVARSDGSRYDVSAVDPHLSAVVRAGTGALRFSFDHTTVAPKPLEAERNDSALQNTPLAPLAPERGDSYELSYELGGRDRLRLTLFSKDERDRIDVIPTDYRGAAGAGQNPATGPGIPQNVGALIVNGAELAFDRGPLSLSATYVHARSSSASQFGLNDLNAPAIAANHLFPVGYVPDFSAIASYKLRLGKVTVTPSLSYESGYPYGNGRLAWMYGPGGVPIQVINDNHLDPGYSYYFLRDPSQPYNVSTNPIIGSLGTPEGDDPNTLRSAPLLLVSLHVESALSPRVTLALDVANLFGTATPTQLTGNPYLIGPPGYTGGNPAYAQWYGKVFGSGSYSLGNGVPTNDGSTPAVPWTYGSGAYVPSSYPEARSVYLRVRVRV